MLQKDFVSCGDVTSEQPIAWIELGSKMESPAAAAPPKSEHRSNRGANKQSTKAKENACATEALNLLNCIAKASADTPTEECASVAKQLQACAQSERITRFRIDL